LSISAGSFLKKNSLKVVMLFVAYFNIFSFRWKNQFRVFPNVIAGSCIGLKLISHELLPV
jgi:hypothetical protein